MEQAAQSNPVRKNGDGLSTLLNVFRILQYPILKPAGHAALDHPFRLPAIRHEPLALLLPEHHDFRRVGLVPRHAAPFRDLKLDDLVDLLERHLGNAHPLQHPLGRLDRANLRRGVDRVEHDAVPPEPLAKGKRLPMAPLRHRGVPVLSGGKARHHI